MSIQSNSACTGLILSLKAIFDGIASEAELQIYYPDGKLFSSYTETARRAEQAEQKAARLAEKLRSLGIDPNQI